MIVMLSYRHAFHAGNHADVIKHLVLVQVLRYLLQKSKALWAIDTHAGAGLYELDRGFALQTAEYLTGISLLWPYAKAGSDRIPAAVGDYLSLVHGLNPDGELKKYPGSPWLIQRLLRHRDKLFCFEKHSNESRILQDNFKTAAQVRVSAGDGFQGLRALLPPLPRRGLILIDPSYETRDDYHKVLTALRESLDRFATGVYILWYPLLSRTEARRLPEKLHALPVNGWLDVTLSVLPATTGSGLTGSGLFIINPPWTLEKTLRETLPWLQHVLAPGLRSGFSLQSKTA